MIYYLRRVGHKTKIEKILKHKRLLFNRYRIYTEERNSSVWVLSSYKEADFGKEEWIQKIFELPCVTALTMTDERYVRYDDGSYYEGCRLSYGGRQSNFSLPEFSTSLLSKDWFNINILGIDYDAANDLQKTLTNLISLNNEYSSVYHYWDPCVSNQENLTNLFKMKEFSKLYTAEKLVPFKF